jgi:D-inositol-3-phosphate glycosyltransferase
MALMKKNGFLEIYPVCLAIIGGEPGLSDESISAEMKRLRDLQESLGIGDMILFLGRQDQDTLQYYYSAAEIVVVPSHYESFGLVALEAMASGTPVVASETGGLVFLIKDGETGYHVPAGDPAALAERLMELLSDSELAEKMGKQAAEYAKGFSWPIVADEIVELYETVLAEDRKEPA